MSASNPSRFLATSTADYGLSLQMFWGGLYEAYRDESVLFAGGSPALEFHTITQGRSHQFLMMADTPAAEIHTPGTELLGQQFEIQDGTITVDDILVSHHDVPLDQWKLSHVDIVGKLGQKVGSRLARELDQRAFYIALNAARTASVSKNGLTVHSGGNRVSTANATSVATLYPVSSAGAVQFRKDAAQLAKQMDDDFVPDAGRRLYITPYIRQVLGMNTDIFDVRYSPGTPNSLDSRVIGLLEGFQVIVAKGRIPSTNVTSYTGVHTKYNGNFSAGSAAAGAYEPVALALCNSGDGQAAVGVASAMGISPDMMEDKRRNTMFIKAQCMIGMGVLLPWHAGVIEVSATA